MQKSGNPAFNKSAIDSVSLTSKKVMTTSGTYVKTFLLLMIVIVAAAVSWQWMKESIVSSDIRWLPLWIVSILTLIIGMTISFNPKKAPQLAIVYAVLQGGLLGIISGTFANSYEGIVGQAVFTTLAVFLAVYVGYALGFLRATPAFARIIITAILGLLMYSILSWLLSLFTFSTPVTYSYGTWGIVFSIAVVLVAALSLVLDFDFIDNAVAQKYPKYFEWYAAFGLMVGLIWLYMEILRLLAKMAARSQR
jgi:uncharacterized YccA/Bax inhibitor family protein